ncbi:MAG: hypothetical protein JHC33_09035 [Ignisphaera sp.]|nr:hypothetical protein [Ignisphaera sp.]
MAITYEKYLQDCARLNVEPTMSERDFDNMLRNDILENIYKQPSNIHITPEERQVAKQEYNRLYRQRIKLKRPPKQVKELLSEEEKKERKRLYAKRVREANLAKGLTWNGKERKTAPRTPKEPKQRVLLTEEEKRERARENSRRWNAANKERYRANKRKSLQAKRDKKLSAECNPTAERTDSQCQDNACKG